GSGLQESLEQCRPSFLRSIGREEQRTWLASPQLGYHVEDVPLHPLSEVPGERLDIQEFLPPHQAIGIMFGDRNGPVDSPVAVLGLDTTTASTGKESQFTIAGS